MLLFQDPGCSPVKERRLRQTAKPLATLSDPDGIIPDRAALNGVSPAHAGWTFPTSASGPKRRGLIVRFPSMPEETNRRTPLGNHQVAPSFTTSFDVTSSVISILQCEPSSMVY